MSRTNLQDGRTNQKYRTRQAILEAANRLVEAGKNPSLDEIANEAMVSRATAYRYFPNIERLLIEAPLHKQTATAEEIFQNVRNKTDSERVAIVHDHLHDLIAGNEISFRMFLRSCMDEWVKSDGKIDKYLRGGRRLPMIDEALKDFRTKLPQSEYRRLRFALAAMVSVESYVALRDVCGLKPAEAKKIMRWAVQTLVDAVKNK